MSQTERRYDRLSVRLSLIISRLLAGETLNMRKLAAEFGVSERTRSTTRNATPSCTSSTEVSRYGATVTVVCP